MEWRFPIYFLLLLLLLWLGPFIPTIFQQDISKAPPDTSAPDRRLLKICFRGLIAIVLMALLSWYANR